MNPTLNNLRKYGANQRTGLIAPNTYASNVDGHLSVVFHATRIYEETDHGFIVEFNGYTTVTTYARINALLPAGYKVFQKDFQAYIQQPEGSVSKLNHYGPNRIQFGWYFPDFGGESANA